MNTKNSNKIEEKVIELTPKDEKIKKTKKLKRLHECSQQKSEVLESSPVGAPEEKIRKVTALPTVFQHFKELTNEEDVVRIDAALQLLQQLSKTKESEERKRELDYTLKRLVRGCGASTNTSRAGFFTGLIAFLKVFDAAEVSLEQIFETLEKELHVGKTIANKEDADAVVGKVLICGALLHAGRISGADNEHVKRIVIILLQATKHRTYHASLGFSFLIELIETLSESQFESIVWPLLQKELTKPWPKQSLQTVHCLMEVKRKFPTILNSKYLKEHFGGKELLNPSSYSFLHKIFWENSNTDVLTHPAFEIFGSYIATCSKLSEFWVQTVDPALQTPTKLIEIETLKIATDILNNLNIEKTKISDLLSPNFMRLLVDGLRNLKQKKDETLKAFYDEFLEALVSCCSKKAVTDTQRVEVISRLVLPPGTFNIEKYTTTRVVHQIINSLGQQGIIDTFELYKSIFLSAIPKNKENSSEKWLNFERLNAGYMLQHLVTQKSVAQAYNWREEQLRFFFTCGIFYVNDTASEICKKDAAGLFSKDFGEQCKNMFYSSLKSKLLDLQEECNLLVKLVHFCNEQIQRKHAAKYFRVKNFDDQLLQAWNSVYSALEQQDGCGEKKKTSKSELTKLKLVFRILLSNMGLQLFRDPEMAIPAVADLLKCLQRIEKQRELKKKKKNGESDQVVDKNDEPEWIEVVVDLFLHLLSQNASDLRNIVNALFPHLCDNLTLSSIHQILSMLDMKDGQNPLSVMGKEDEQEEEEEDQEDDGDNKNKNERDRKEQKKVKENGHREKCTDEEGSDDSEGDDENEDDDEEDDDDDDDDDDDEEDDDEMDEGLTETDKLRNAISQALLETGAAVGQDDVDSVDLNDISEEEGKKLDEALANAFKAIKKTDTGARKRKSKSYRVQTTSLMHFRIRVLDLIEIYLKKSPTLLVSIEIMLVLFDMLQFCVSEELKPLQIKVQNVLTTLTSLKTYTIDTDLNEDNLVDFIRLVLEKKAPAAVFNLMNKLRTKCIVFLISSTNKVVSSEETPSKVLAFCKDALEEFIKSRNPTMNVTQLSEIFKLRWSGVWKLAVTLAQQGVSSQTRNFRRIQVCEVLSVFYKNTELLKEDVEFAKHKLKKIEKSIGQHIKSLESAVSVKLSAREFQTLLELLLNIQRAYQKLQLPSNLLSPDTFSVLQNLRRKLKLESMKLYQQFCATFKLKIIRNNELVLPENIEQNHSQHMDVDDDDDGEQPVGEKPVYSSTSKTKENGTDTSSNAESRKEAARNLRKEKKLKKRQRMEMVSKGLNGGIEFAKATEDSGED